MVVFIIAISLPLVLFGLYGLLFLKSTRQIGDSLEQLDHLTFPELEETLQEKERERLYINLLGDQQRAVFTGIEQKGDTTYTYALQIQAIDSVSLKYRIERLVHWKSLPDIQGIAQFNTTSLDGRAWQIQTTTTATAAYRFLDRQAACSVELLFTKVDYRSSQALVKELCKTETKALTPNLRWK